MQRVEDLYEKTFLDFAPSDGFWNRFLSIESELGKKLGARPIGNLEIDAACNAAFKAFTSAINDEQRARAAAEKGRS
jgi:hypothetical protein